MSTPINYRYFSKITHTLQTKNKLEKIVLALFKEAFDRRITTSKSLPKFKQAIIDLIELHNTHIPKCKPIVAEFSKSSTTDGDWLLQLPFLHYRLYRECINYNAEDLTKKIFQL